MAELPLSRASPIWRRAKSTRASPPPTAKSASAWRAIVRGNAAGAGAGAFGDRSRCEPFRWSDSRPRQHLNDVPAYFRLVYAWRLREPAQLGPAPRFRRILPRTGWNRSRRLAPPRRIVRSKRRSPPASLSSSAIRSLSGRSSRGRSPSRARTRHRPNRRRTWRG